MLSLSNGKSISYSTGLYTALSSAASSHAIAGDHLYGPTNAPNKSRLIPESLHPYIVTRLDVRLENVAVAVLDLLLGGRAASRVVATVHLLVLLLEVNAGGNGKHDGKSRCRKVDLKRWYVSELSGRLNFADHSHRTRRGNEAAPCTGTGSRRWGCCRRRYFESNLMSARAPQLQARSKTHMKPMASARLIVGWVMDPMIKERVTMAEEYRVVGMSIIATSERPGVSLTGQACESFGKAHSVRQC